MGALRRGVPAAPESHTGQPLESTLHELLQPSVGKTRPHDKVFLFTFASDGSRGS